MAGQRRAASLADGESTTGESQSRWSLKNGRGWWQQKGPTLM